jgi:hypothetical protein
LEKIQWEFDRSLGELDIRSQQLLSRMEFVEGSVSNATPSYEASIDIQQRLICFENNCLALRDNITMELNGFR